LKRVRATGLALANWKGVFFERYLLDRHVTALEGANGAGKTTVMIAAYVVLLPDMSRLRFTNLGETAATGGDRGVWGRLGEAGRPSYSALDFELADGRRLIAGVQLVRKAEPSVELNPFIVSDLDPGVRLSDLLLVSSAEHDEIPSLEQLAENVSKASAKLTVFQTSKEYFAALFEHGALPLRLASDEERNKLNEVLRTSMTGGISRALTSELRSFLLREETGLSDTLTRMRGNLEACRRTRVEVLEARALEHEISGIFDAGSAMFAAAFGSARVKLAEGAARTEAARARITQAERERAELDAELRRAVAEEDAQSERRKQTQAELGGTLEQLRRAEQAAALAVHLATVSTELAERERAASDARAARDAASTLRQTKKLEREQAREAYERAARGLADSKSGLDELHRNAAAERQLTRLLYQARALLRDPNFELEALAAMREKLAQDLTRLDRARAEQDREHELRAVRQRDFGAAHAALKNIVGSDLGGDPYERGRQALRELAEFELKATRQAELATAHEQATALAARQLAARRRANHLGLDTNASAQGVRQALQSSELALQSLDRECSEQRAASKAALAAAGEKRRLAEHLAAERPRFEDFKRRKRDLTERLNATLESEADFNALQTRLIAEREQLRAEVLVRARQREAAKAAASALVLGSNNLEPELIAIRDELDGELLASRFEELGLEEAATMEAELGPLAQGLLVADAERAGRELAGRPRQLQNVFLVSEGALAVRAANSTLIGDDLLVRENYGVRLTRRPRDPILGRLARKRRVEELEASCSTLDRTIEELEQRSRTLEASLRECHALASEAAHFLDEPRPPAELEQEARALALAAEGQEQSANAAADSAAALRLKARELTFLLEEAFLLDSLDQSELAAALQTELEASTAAARELARTADARKTLNELLDALRAGDPNVATAAEADQGQATLKAERDRVYSAGVTLDELTRLRAQVRFPEAERLLAEQTALLPTLSAQHDAAREREAKADLALEEAELAWEGALARFAEADAGRAAAEAHQRRLRAEIEELGGSAALTQPSNVALKARLEQLSSLLDEFRVAEQELSAKRGARAERREQLSAKIVELEAEHARAELELEPLRRTFAELEREVESLRLSATLTSSSLARSERSSAALAAEAAGKLDLLLGRLATARGGPELLARLGDVSPAPEACLRAWVTVRAWLTERVPAQIASVAEPLIALERLRDQLSTLEQRLGRQELDLRGASEDVARGIEVGIRRAKAQVRRLNQTLDGIAFGSIQGIRVQMRRVERMDQVLAALRDGAAQELLFQSNLPIEEAFNEIFRRFAGGKSGAQKLLDYREYLELSVEIQRRATTEWELANPARLSTGEAIGVGATLMMVVLTEWERDANLLRGQKSGGTLRFLFLDEANRLSQDNLGVLFELCKTLDLQLLIAAPEVARAEGNTTYRLIRRVSDAGQEEVIVTGRRAATREEREAEDLAPSASPPAGPIQFELLS
jgi:chromosome partition protein MukB